ncbi:unnamed protein product [Lactuca virosa]|uniref:chorismate mutase n=1 Tax=Lactuca virosa TaxID=75947 RepID=A0AAU9PL39_9ASTR|nr:unnamed protein product [Lactuca virosa]
MKSQTPSKWAVITEKNNYKQQNRVKIFSILPVFSEPVSPKPVSIRSDFYTAIRLSMFRFKPVWNRPGFDLFDSIPSDLGTATKNWNLQISNSGVSKNGVQSVQASATSFGSKNETRVDESEIYTLDGIRSSLIRQEDSIIFSLVERAQFCYNEDTYDPNAFFMDGFKGSLVEFMVKETEKVHAQVGRYKSPDEHPFFPKDLPDPMLPPLEYPQVLHPYL